MLGSDGGDRGALVALGMILFAVVVVTAINCQASGSDFNPWQDSYAQWSMVVLSALALGVSVWAVRLVGKTLAETKEATKAAREANATTLKAIEQDNLNSQRQLRAYLFVETATISITNGGVSAQIDIRNSGASPAKSVRLRLHLQAVVTMTKLKVESYDWQGQMIEEALGVIPTSAAARTMMIGWDNRIFGKARNMDDYSQWSSADPHILLTLNGELNWIDVFEAKHSLNVSLVCEKFIRVYENTTSQIPRFQCTAIVHHSDPEYDIDEKQTAATHGSES